MEARLLQMEAPNGMRWCNKDCILPECARAHRLAEDSRKIGVSRKIAVDRRFSMR